MAIEHSLLEGSSTNPLFESSRQLIKKRGRGLIARSTCIHPQLRDLLVCPNQPGEVIGHSYHSLARYSWGKRASLYGSSSSSSSIQGRRDHLQTLNFIPNVVSKGCGLLAAGGHTAELAIRSSDPNSRWLVQTHVGKSINNSAFISPSPWHPLSVPRIHVSNNDYCIYWYDLHFPKRWGSLEYAGDYGLGGSPLHESDEAIVGQPELEFVDRIRLDTPINHTSISPDGRKMVAVGDTNEVFMFAVGNNGTHTLIDTVEAASDASFSTSWSRTGDSFAVASQDGSVTVFDVRYLTPLKRFETYQRGPSGAARVVKYSPGPNELLAFSEQKNYVHVVDARTYEYEETIYLPGVELQDVSRTGLSGGGLRSAHAHLAAGAGGGSLAGAREVESTPDSRSLNPWDTMPWDAETLQPMLEWQDCPPLHRDYSLLHPPMPPLSPWNAYPATSGYASPMSYPSPPSSARPSPSPRAGNANVQTVSQVLGSEVPPAATSPGGSVGNGAPSGTSVTGLDWDPTGQYLYASMERIIIEWQVDSTSRRCHPQATIL